jgi:predicted DNA repair protein MutK
MRILNVLCGMAVLFTTLALAHLIHHHAGHASSSDFHSPAFLASFVAAIAVAILSLIGGCLLIRRGR